MASGRTAVSNAKSGRNVGSTSRSDSRLAFGRQVHQTHRTHRTQGIIFADEGGGEEQEMWGGGRMWVRSDVTSGRNRRWEWSPDAGDAEDGKTTSDASGRGASASDAGLIFADDAYATRK